MFFREDEDAIFEEDTNEWVTKKQAEHIRQLRASNERLRQQLEVARKALEPLVPVLQFFEKSDDSMGVWATQSGNVRFTVGHLRAAAAAYDKIEATQT